MNKKHPANSALTAYMTNANFGGKVVLWCMDAMYPSSEVDGAPFNGVALAPFNGKQMSSLILSLDGVAEECVSYDFWSAISGKSGGTGYLNDAANAGAGVVDHWNNSTAKQYAKNLDPNANGIELVTVVPQSSADLNETAYLKEYRGKPFHDSVYPGGPQIIPGRIQCAYYDLGGEGVAYHDSDATNSGSGGLNKADGTYLNEFRINESVDISYTKFHQTVPIDDNPFDLVRPSEGQLYVGWTDPGEWFNLTAAVQQAGVYTIDLLYTSNRSGKISLDLNGKPLVSSIDIIPTKNNKEPVAWRQWHHWNVMTNMAEVTLPKGVCVLTLHVVTEGNMNFAYLDFKPKK